MPITPLFANQSERHFALCGVGVNYCKLASSAAEINAKLATESVGTAGHNRITGKFEALHGPMIAPSRGTDCRPTGGVEQAINVATFAGNCYNSAPIPRWRFPHA